MHAIIDAAGHSLILPCKGLHDGWSDQWVVRVIGWRDRCNKWYQGRSTIGGDVVGRGKSNKDSVNDEWLTHDLLTS